MKHKVGIRNIFCIIMALSIIFSISSINTFAENASVRITSPSEDCSYTVGDKVKLSAVVVGKRHKTTRFFVKTSPYAKEYIYGNNPKTGNTPTDSWDTTGSEPGTYFICAVIYDAKGKELAMDCRKIKLKKATGKKITVSGYVAPDYPFLPETAHETKSGFIVKLIPNTTAEDGVLQTETDEAGYFKIENVPQIDEGYRMEIRKKNYLTRYIDNLELTEDTELSGMDFPIILWVGDFVQDDAINMEDLMKLTEYLGSYRGASDYIEDFDPNRDGVVNIMDIAIVVSNFNKVPADYEKS